MFKYLKQNIIKVFEMSKSIGATLFALSILFYFVNNGFVSLKIINSLFNIFMQWLDLPKEYGFSWLIAMLNTIESFWGYSTMIMGEYQINIRQITVLSVLVLNAHAIFIESIPAKKLGFKFFPFILLRLILGFFSAFVLNSLLSRFESLDVPARSVVNSFINYKPNMEYFEILNEFSQGYAFIVVFIFFVIAFHDFLDKIKFYKYIKFIIKPIISLIGVKSTNDKELTVIALGLLFGPLYCSSILQETYKDEQNKINLFFILFFITISHLVINDMLLLSFLGPNFFVMFCYKLIFGIVITAIITIVLKSLPQGLFEILFVKKR